MQIGFLTAPFHGSPLDELLLWAQEEGFEAAEVVAHPEAGHIHTSKVVAGEAEEVAKLFRNHGIRISSLATYQNALDPDPQARKQASDALRLSIDAAKMLGVDVVCTIAGMAPPGKDKMAAIEQDFAEVFTPIVDHAAKKGVRIALENWYATLLQGLDHWDRVFQVVPHPNLGLNFDPSHLYWMQVDHIEAVHRFANRIFHVHAKDCLVSQHVLRQVGVLGRGWWRYCIPGYGGIHWGEFIAHLRSVKYDGVLSIEHEDSAFGREEGFKKGRRHLAQLV